MVHEKDLGRGPQERIPGEDAGEWRGHDMFLSRRNIGLAAYAVIGAEFLWAVAFNHTHRIT